MVPLAFTDKMGRKPAGWAAELAVAVAVETGAC
jgi:hypothetical protein